MTQTLSIPAGPAGKREDNMTKLRISFAAQAEEHGIEESEAWELHMTQEVAVFYEDRGKKDKTDMWKAKSSAFATRLTRQNKPASGLRGVAA